MKCTAAEWKKYYLTEEFRDKYTYDGELGFCIKDGKTVFKLWSPVAKEVRLRLFRDGKDSPAFEIEEMKKGERGVWECLIDKNLTGIYYDFQLSIEGAEVVSADPYARACGVNGKRSMVLDFSSVNPSGWEADIPPGKEEEDIIYELHVKEFSHDKSGGFPEEVRGKYKAFAVEGTTLYNEGNIPTGTEHIKLLGVNHIQLMPVYDYASVDEEGEEEQFNWGYDPLNYNVPEGSYSTDALNGEVRIREFKEMILALHKKGFRVIMDVVYNHTYNLDTPLQKTVPYYHYRLDRKGGLSNGSGCGNDIACEMPMTEKYILDSVLYWAREYHIDGFIFDLMGLLTVRLMNRIRTALDKEYGKGEKLIYGEPWAAGKTFTAKRVLRADKKNIARLNKNIGFFSDDIRDSIKGTVFCAKEGGFVNGGTGFTDRIEAYMKAEGIYPGRIISYVSCHDNHTLWDKLTATTASRSKRLRQYKLAAAIYMCCLGRIFIYSGEEFLRTKGGRDNTYKESVEINKLDYSLIAENGEMVEYYRRLISVRKRISGICSKASEAAENIETICKKEGFLAVRIKEEAVVIFNASENEEEIELAEGSYEAILDSKEAKGEPKRKKIVGGEVKIKPISAMILLVL